MNPADNAYHDLVEEIYDHGERHENRTGTDTQRIWGHMARFELQRGFPLLTSKKMAVKTAFTELLGFVRGETDVRWYQERGCKIWNADHERWHGKDLDRDQKRLNELKALLELDPTETPGDSLAEEAEDCRRYLALEKEAERLEASINLRVDHPHSLGNIYGKQWRDFNGHDQLGDIITALKAGSNSRRLIMSAWNPADFHLMCLPPCHISYHFVRRGKYLDIAMWQRSVDTGLGLSFNWANTALLCHLVAHATALTPGNMVWFGDDVHIYDPHLELVYEQVHREPRPAPSLLINCPPETMPWDVEPDHLQIVNYDPHPSIKLPLFVG